MRKRRLMLQTQRRHPRVHRKPLQSHMAQQRGRDAGGKGWQWPTPGLGWTVEQQVGIGKGRQTTGSSGGSRRRNPLSLRSPRCRQQEQQIKAGILVTPHIELGLQLLLAAARAENQAARREPFQIRGDQGQQVHAGAAAALGSAR